MLRLNRLVTISNFVMTRHEMSKEKAHKLVIYPIYWKKIGKNGKKRLKNVFGRGKLVKEKKSEL